MIERMKYVNIMGSVGDFERVVLRYISRFDIQLESSAKELAGTRGIAPLNTPDAYTVLLRRAEKIVVKIGAKPDIDSNMTKEEALSVLEAACAYAEQKGSEIEQKEARLEEYKQFIQLVDPYCGLNCRVEDLSAIKFIKFRFGCMPINSYLQFRTLLYANANMLFVESKRTNDFMYGICFIPDAYIKEADSIMSTFHFERARIPFAFAGKDLHGTLRDVYEGAVLEMEDEEEALKRMVKEQQSGSGISPDELATAYERIKQLQFYLETRRFAIKTKQDFYILVGWMSDKDAQRLLEASDDDPRVVITVSDGGEATSSTPPTKIKNVWFIKPFEMLVTMYGIPSYNEIDPTIFLALVYTLLFGVMFGDVGQGAVLSVIGLALYKLKGLNLGRIIAIIGVSSVFFGFMYGSIFGLEHVYEGTWKKPTENINTILITAVAAGIILIITAMLLNMINGAKQKNPARILLGPNGVTGLVFYLSAVGIALSALTGVKLPTGALSAIAAACLVLIWLSHPLAQVLQRQRVIFHGGVGQYLFEAVIELFEVMLSYFANTVSFVRVGAFALSHAGIMGVVYMLSLSADGQLNPVGMVFGNIVVIGFEGLVVGIQVVRLNFYEMFSRFYEGGGHKFVPYRSLIK